MKVSLTDSQKIEVFQKLQKGSSIPARVGVKTLTGGQDACTTSLSSIELEKHLNDYQNGYGNVSKQTASKVKSLDVDTVSQYSNEPKLMFSYNHYKTGFNYAKKSRYIQNNNQFAKNYAHISDAADKLNQLKEK